MKAKEYLQQLQKLDVLIDQKLKELSDLRSTLTSIGGIDYSKERVQTSPSGDAPYVNTLTKIVDLDAEINADIDRFVDQKHEIINQIQALQNVDEVDLLHKRYVEYKTFEMIAVEMHYTIRNIYFIHGRALKSFQDAYLEG